MVLHEGRTAQSECGLPKALTSWTILSSTAVLSACACRLSGDTFRISASCSRAARYFLSLYLPTAQR